MKAKRVRKEHNIKDLDVTLKNIAAEIHAFREREQVSQGEFARRASVSKTTINDLENEVASDIQLSTLLMIAATLNIAPTALMTESDLELSESDRKKFLKIYESLLCNAKELETLYRRIK
jgi:transcriptional regulator with XRE-family HTH domain